MISTLKTCFRIRNDVGKSCAIHKRLLNLLEYQSKEVLKNNGISIQNFYTVNVDGTVSGSADLVADEYVIKAQILAGGRGRGHFSNGFAGGVHVVKNKTDVDGVVAKMLGHNLITKQTHADGVHVKTVMIAESVRILSEKYVCILLDRAENGPVLLASPVGGMDIEQTAKESPHLIRHYAIDIERGLLPQQLDDIVDFLRIERRLHSSAREQLQLLWSTFLKIDALQLEINPLAETADNRVVCVDAKIVVDDNAKFRQAEIFDFEQIVRRELDRYEFEAAESNLNYVRLSGDIGCLVNGAGLAMATMDLLACHGGKAANFLDVGGGVTETQVHKAFEIISNDPQVKVIFVNVFGGIVNCLTIAKGLVAALETLRLAAMPLVVRLEGTNVLQAKAFLQAVEQFDIRIADDFNDGAKIAVEQSQRATQSARN